MIFTQIQNRIEQNRIYLQVDVFQLPGVIIRAYDDDILILTQNQLAVWQALQMVAKFCASRYLKLNKKKSQILRIATGFRYQALRFDNIHGITLQTRAKYLHAPLFRMIVSLCGPAGSFRAKTNFQILRARVRSSLKRFCLAPRASIVDVFDAISNFSDQHLNQLLVHWRQLAERKTGSTIIQRFMEYTLVLEIYLDIGNLSLS